MKRRRVPRPGRRVSPGPECCPACGVFAPWLLVADMVMVPESSLNSEIWEIEAGCSCGAVFRGGRLIAAF